jgi:MYXO-CTERM domain-containing protein
VRCYCAGHSTPRQEVIVMMTLAFGLIALSLFFLWRRRTRWGWAAVMVALVLGIIIFMGDVDFTSKLGVQL